MKRQFEIYASVPMALAIVLASCVAVAQDGGNAQTQPTSPAATSPATPPKDTHITSDQAKELFRSVDQITQFASHDSGLASRHSVKRRLTTRDEVERYINDRMKEDKDTQRVERSLM